MAKQNKVAVPEGTPRLPPITPRPAGEQARLSFLQERFWLEQRFSPDQATHNVPVFFRLRGELDQAALHKAIEGVLRRHDVLRSRIVEVDGEPRVQIEPFEGLRLDEADLSSAGATPGQPAENEAEDEQVVATLLLELLEAPFDLARAPLMRGALYRIGAHDWILALVFHQSVFDSLSDPVLRRELAADYASAHAAEETGSTQRPELQYGDFAAWQRLELAGQLTGELARWRERLEGLGEPLTWPADRRRLPSPSRRGAQILRQLPPKLRAQLVHSSAELSLSPESLVIAALASMLARVGTHGFVTLGLPVALRPPELEPLIGNFDNMVVLAAQLEGDPTFHHIATQLAAETRAIRSQAAIPYEQLVEALRPDRTPESNPFFRVFFHCLPASHRHLRLHDLEISRLSPPSLRSRHDLEITLVDGGSRGMALSFVYNLDLYESATAERFAESFLLLLGCALEDPHQRLSQLAMIPSETRKALEAASRGRRVQWPEDRTLVGLFEAWVDQWRDDPAVVYGRHRRTYGELDNAANFIARKLIDNGVRPGEVVGLCCPPSVDMVAAFLGVLKAGAVVAPLDPEDPPMRLHRMLERSNARKVLAHPAIAFRFESWSRDLLLLDESLPTEGIARLPRLANQRSAAMLLFTSGSTGEPKGVLLARGNLIRLILALEDLALAPGLTFGQISSFTFDAIAFELFGAFSTGGKLVGIEREKTTNAAAFRSQLDRDGIDVLLVTSANFHLLARQNPRVFANLPLILFGGERADVEVVKRVLREGKPQRLIHAYGPTEATTFATWYEVRELDAKASNVPIGRPLAETTVHVLDRLGQRAPIGVPGELYLGGRALALGYFAAPAATAEAFLPNPGEGEPGELLYRSGDLARVSDKLELEFVGRVDHQVKVGGMRIELGEIEAELGNHPAVAQKVVVQQSDAGGKPHLIAFVVPQPSVDAPAGNELRTFLSQRLPQFMVPSSVILLGILPMTPHGKVDRRSLPHFTLLAGDDEQENGPRDEVEIVLERLWCEVMGADHVAIEANFFDLGGHSLLATQLLSKVRGAFGVDLPLREVFRSPTIAQMAELVREARAGGHHLAAPPLHRWPEPHPLSAMQARRYRALTIRPYTSERCSTLAADLVGKLDLQSLPHALQVLTSEHDALRSRVEMHGDEPYWKVEKQIELPLVLEDLDPNTATALADSLDAEARRPFLPEDFFWRCRLLKLGEEHHVFAITVHRLLLDTASERLLWWNLASQYRGQRRGIAVPSAPRAISHGDWSAHRRHWLVNEAREAVLKPWRAWLEKAPVWNAGPYPAQVLRRNLPPILVRAIRGIAQKQNCPPTAVVLAAWCALLAREEESTSRHLLVASSLDGRHYPELERILGSFESKIVLRVDTRGNSFSALLNQVLQTQRFALDHRDLSFAELIHDLAPQADPRQDPFCTTAFRWLAGNLPSFDELETSYLPVDGGWAVHSKELCIVETPQAWRAELTYDTDQAQAELWLRDLKAILLRAAEQS